MEELSPEQTHAKSGRHLQLTSYVNYAFNNATDRTLYSPYEELCFQWLFLMKQKVSFVFVNATGGVSECLERSAGVFGMDRCEWLHVDLSVVARYRDR